MTLAHWVYALGTITVVVTMILRRNVLSLVLFLLFNWSYF